MSSIALIPDAPAYFQSSDTAEKHIFEHAYLINFGSPMW
jgi:hypothetical protein